MNDLNQLLDQLQQARTRYQRAKEAPSGKARAFRLLEEARKRHPEWQVKRIDEELFTDNLATYKKAVGDAPLPMCKKCKVKVCEHYGPIGGFSVQCKGCNVKQSEKRRASYASRKLTA